MVENERRQMRAFRWSSVHGLEQIVLDGDSCAAEGVSSDGNTAGWIRTANNQKQVFRWTQGKGVEVIGAQARDWIETIAYDVSDDGLIIAGSGRKSIV